MAEDAEAALWDPYAQLDPHDKGSLPIKPFRKGRKPPQRGCRAGAAPAMPSWAVHMGCACMAPQPARQGCAFAEFEGAWRAAQAQAKAARHAAAHAADAYLLLTGPGDAQGPCGSDDEADGLGGESWLAHRSNGPLLWFRRFHVMVRCSKICTWHTPMRYRACGAQWLILMRAGVVLTS